MKNNLFKFTNILSLALALLMLGVTVFSIKSYIQTTETTPKIGYSEVKNELDKKPIEQKEGEQKKPGKIEKHTIDLIEKYDLQIENKGIIDGWVNFYAEEDQKTEFLNSMAKLLQEHQMKLAKDSINTIDKFETINTHREMYQKEFRDLNKDGYEKKISQFSFISLAIIATLMFMIFMMAPVLIQIEKNTRKEQTN